MSIIIRQATPADIPAIHSLVAELADYLGESDNFVTTPAVYETDMADDFFHALIAETDGKVVGMTLYYYAYSTWKGRMIYLEDFVLSPKYRRRGIGQQLWEALKETGRKRNCKLLKWQVINSDEAAMKFYLAQDAIIEDNWLNGKLFL